MLEQTSLSYGGLKLGLFVTKGGLFAQFQRASFGKSSQIYIYIYIRSPLLEVCILHTATYWDCESTALRGSIPRDSMYSMCLISKTPVFFLLVRRKLEI